MPRTARKLMEVSDPQRRQFAGATAIGIALAVYAIVSLGGGVALGGPADLDTESGFGGGDGIAQVPIPNTGTFAFLGIADAALQADGKYIVVGDGNVTGADERTDF